MKRTIKWLFIIAIAGFIPALSLASEELTPNEIQEQRNAMLRNIYRDPAHGERFVDYLNMMVDHLKADDIRGSLVATQGAYKLLLKGWVQPAGFADFAATIIGQIWHVRESNFSNVYQTADLLKNNSRHFLDTICTHNKLIEDWRSQLKRTSDPASENLDQFYKYLLLLSMQRDMAHVVDELKHKPDYEHPWSLAVVAFAEMQSIISQIQENKLELRSLPFKIDATARKHMLADNLPMPQLLATMLTPAGITTDEQMAEWLEKLQLNGRTFAQQQEQIRLTLNQLEARLIRRFVNLQQPLANLYKAHEINDMIADFPFPATSAFISSLMEYLPDKNKDAFTQKLLGIIPIYPDISWAKDPIDINDFSEKISKSEVFIINLKSAIKKVEENAGGLEQKSDDLNELYRHLYLRTLFHNVLWFTLDHYKNQATLGSSAYILGNIGLEEFSPYMDGTKETYILLSIAQRKAFLEETLYNPTPLVH